MKGPSQLFVAAIVKQGDYSPMATTENIARAQSLYVAYYGRPADQEGLDYWADRLEAEGEAAIINAFGNSEEYAALAEGQGNATLVNNIYLQAFGRDADVEGLAYYTGVLANGEKTLAEIALTITNAAQGIDKQTFDARVEAAAAYTEEFGAAADYDLVAAKEAIENAEPGLFVPGVTPAIEELQAAQQAASDYLQNEVASNEAITEYFATPGNEPATAGEPTDAEISAALTAELGDAVTDVESAADTGFTLSDNASVAAAQIAAQKEDFAEAIQSAEQTVSQTDGLQAAINSMLTAENRFETALKAELASSTALTAEAAKADALNTGAIAADTTAGDEVLATLDTNDFLVANASGEVVLASGLTASDYEGLDALIEAAQAQYDAEVAVEARTELFEKAAVRVINLENDSTNATFTDTDYTIDAEGNVTFDITATAPNSQALLTAETDSAEFDEAVADYQELASLSAQYTMLTDAVDDAEEAFADLDINLEDYAAAATATAENDLFLFDADVETAELTDFGTDGEDLLYFGEGFELVQLGTDAAAEFLTGTDFSADVGSSSALEIFWAQNGNDLELFVENKAFAGNSTSGEDFSTITLTGVSAADITFENGFLSAGEPA